eukprot:6120723-Amphidinium_carterae.1
MSSRGAGYMAGPSSRALIVLYLGFREVPGTNCTACGVIHFPLGAEPTLKETVALSVGARVRVRELP